MSSLRSLLSVSHAAILRRYFYSGWAFLTPYLAVYLLYYVTKWPVNPVGKTQNPELQISNTWVPCMLHVYWGLHAIHVTLAGLALWSWFSSDRLKCQVPSNRYQDDTTNSDLFGRAPEEHQLPPAAYAPTSDLRPSTSGPWPLAIRLTPWLLLALLFYIPGVYLEWPSDPWEHLSRINEWRIVDIVGAHSSWMKSSYFIPYSLLSWCIGLRQLFWLDFYYTGICLLLCWQYYRFSRACGLGDRASMVFVIIQALLFGNNIFSFYRYYGISTSIYAQLGAIALTRIILEWAAYGRTNLGKAPPSAVISQFSAFPFFTFSTHPSFWHWPTIFGRLFPITLCLLSFIAFNHLQGVGISILTIFSIIVWRLVQQRKRTLWWLTYAALVAIISASLCWPRHPNIDNLIREGWLTFCGGFNFFQLHSPATDRAMQILGMLGVVNVLAGAILFLRNHVIGYLTIGPILCLCLPIVSIPYANSIQNEIHVYHRMLFAVPMGLAFVTAAVSFCTKYSPIDYQPIEPQAACPKRSQKYCVRSSCSPDFICICACLIVVCITPSGAFGYNRFWNTVARFPEDLQMTPVVSIAGILSKHFEHDRQLKLVTSGAIATIASFLMPNQFPRNDRSNRTGQSTLDSINTTVGTILSSRPNLGDDRQQLIQALSKRPASTWVSLFGPHPEFINSKDACNQTLLQSPSGQRADIFFCDLIPIERNQVYRAEFSVRQIGSDAGLVYLAIAWYDANGELLESNILPPRGAGNPLGWANGTYSYFGLVGEIAPRTWTTYRRAFGKGKASSIPLSAKYLRLGALLNYNAVPHAKIQLGSIKLWVELGNEPTVDVTLSNFEKLVVVSPTVPMISSAVSQSAINSTHWFPQEVAYDLAAGKEITQSCRAANGVSLFCNRNIFEVPEQSTPTTQGSERSPKSIESQPHL